MDDSIAFDPGYSPKKPVPSAPEGGAVWPACPKCCVELPATWDSCIVCGWTRPVPVSAPPAEGRETPDDEDKWPCITCGIPMTENPHPDAGKPEKLLEVGAMWECLPCAFGRGHRAWKRSQALQNKLTASDALVRELVAALEELETEARKVDSSGHSDHWRLDGLCEKSRSALSSARQIGGEEQ